MHESVVTTSSPTKKQSRKWLWVILLVYILVVGAYFRFIGLNWDETYHLHPDERFLTMVETSLEPVVNIKEYFNTATSTLNPNNRGYGFYVYGTLPIFIVRYVAEWTGKIGYDQVHLVGRFISASLDLMTVLLVFLIADRLYRKKALSLLAAAFAAASVLPIQLAHYFTVDSYTNFFVFLAFYFAVRFMTFKQDFDQESDDQNADDGTRWYQPLIEHTGTLLTAALFGLALGMALASKVSAAPLAILLPAAALIRYLQMPTSEKRVAAWVFLRDMVLAGFVSFLAFRIFQPYAFAGPGFFGIGLNDQWLNNLRELAAQSGGDVDFPPALQWARRPIWFALYNMVIWGMGLPLGLLAWASFLWMGVRIFRGEWHQHVLIWSWTAFYFAWQSLNFTRSMRYQMPVYPTLAIITAWGIIALWRHVPHAASNRKPFIPRLARVFSVLIAVVVVSSTVAYAFAFTRIYTRPVTRVDASRWIYENVPGAINLEFQLENGEQISQPLAFRLQATISQEEPLHVAFVAQTGGLLRDVNLSHVLNATPDAAGEIIAIQAKLLSQPNQDEGLASGLIVGQFPPTNDPRGDIYQVIFDQPYTLKEGQRYWLQIAPVESYVRINLSGPMNIAIDSGGELIYQTLPEPANAIRPGTNYMVSFEPRQDATLNRISFPLVVDWEADPSTKVLSATITSGNSSESLSKGTISADFIAAQDPRGSAFVIDLDPPLAVTAGETYMLQLELLSGEGSVALYSKRQAIESTWDDPLPLPMAGYNPFDYVMGLYRSDLNFEMYWDDNLEKLTRFETILDQADYIFISSNRQWGTTVRVPERYPLTSEFYRNLIGCPPEKDIVWCYRVAEPGMFEGTLGFELVQVFTSYPNLGKIEFNTQFAEEAFTVYDHPKVHIFRKTADYDPQNVRDILRAVDLSQTIHLTPRKASGYPGNLMLPPTRLAGQRAGGTWSDLFDWDSLQNRYPVLGLLLWYLAVSFMGWIFYPILRLALPGLVDRGFPAARMAVMLVFAYLNWIAGSAGIPVTRVTLSLIALGIILIGGVLLFLQRKTLMVEMKENWRYYLAVEAMFLGFFVLFLLIRLGNPDLWHPAKGGEKPMDFSYLNAVIKSNTYPPYDPWFAGGYINYYYYGFVILGTFIKWLGIVPSIAYNLLLPTMFANTAMIAFSFGWNLLSPRNGDSQADGRTRLLKLERTPFIAGLASSVGLLILGNLGTVRMIWHGLQRLVAPVPIEEGGFFTRWWWSIQGLWKFIMGTPLPYGIGEWYWNPSRVIPGEPITEFPFFTFLYADPHAHMIALPITLLVLLWGLSILRGRWHWGDSIIEKRAALITSFILGAIFVGALYPTNTWDYPTFLILTAIIVVYTAYRYAGSPFRWLRWFDPEARSLVIGLLAAAALAILSLLFYQPFRQWYGAGYTAVDLWEGAHTPFWSYMTHWGLFLFMIVSWLVVETRDWMIHTPISALKRLRKYREVILVSSLILLAAIIALTILGVAIAWVVIVLGVWCILLILRPGQSDNKRLVLFLIGTGLLLTLAVEQVVLVGDIGRMNTVFKLYLQAWTLLSLSAAASLVWLSPVILREARPWLGTAWQGAAVLLILGALLFPIMGGSDKIRDRMAPDAPHSLDGMAFMPFASYSDNGVDFSLAEDAKAIVWIQENVSGSPVIVEANTPEYRWGSRFSIYTGLPGVVGWNWHQRQQRAVTPSEWVTSRVDEIANFFNTTDREQAKEFIARHDISFIIVGQLERAYYDPLGLAKFENLAGDLWVKVYSDQHTSIFQVIR